MDTVGTIRRIIAENLSIPITDVHPESTAADLAGWDSLRQFVLIMEIEHAFGVQFEIEEVGALDSLPKIAAAVEARAVR